LTSRRSLITLAEALYLLSAGDIQFLTYFMLILRLGLKDRIYGLRLGLIVVMLWPCTPWRWL